VAWTTPRTYTAGETITSTILNTHVRDNLNGIVSPPYAYVRATTSTTLVSSGWTEISFNTEVVDTDTMYTSGSPTRLTAKTAGLYVISGGFAIGTLAANANVQMRFAINGADIPHAGTSVAAGSASYNAMLSTSCMYQFAVNDYLELRGLPSTASVNTAVASGNRAYLQMRWVGP